MHLKIALHLVIVNEQIALTLQEKVNSSFFIFFVGEKFSASYFLI